MKLEDKAKIIKEKMARCKNAVEYRILSNELLHLVSPERLNEKTSKEDAIVCTHKRL